MIPVNRPLFLGNEKRYLADCIDSGWVSSDGPYVERFEKEFGAYIGRKHAIAVSSGTAALDIAVEALGLSPGDEVILPTFTIISCLQQLLRARAVPVFVDADPFTYNMDVYQIEEKITPKTRAILMVHLYGLPVDADPILALARKYNLKVIEDASQMHGQTYKGHKCGTLGDLSTFSFYANKIITTGEGGMVLTDNEELAEQCRSLRNLCHSPVRFVHERLGWNYRMTNLQAAVGCAQLEKIDTYIGIRRSVGKRYKELLGDPTSHDTSYARNNYWVYPVKIMGLAAEHMERLKERGIATRPFFFPLHAQPLVGGALMDYPVAGHLYLHCFYLPGGNGITELEIEHVVETLLEFAGYKNERILQ